MKTADSSLLRILKCFTNSDQLGFTELAGKLGFDTDLAGYYLRKLQRRGLVKKIERGTYQITPLGKSALAHGTQLNGFTLVPRVCIMIVASHNAGYIALERTRQPFIGRVEWPTAELPVGVDMATAATQIAERRLGLIGTQPTLRGIFRRTDLYDGNTFDDKLFAVHTLALNDDQAAQLIAENEIGHVRQLSEPDIRSLAKPSRTLLDILAFSQGQVPYVEHTYELTKDDFYV